MRIEIEPHLCVNRDGATVCILIGVEEEVISEHSRPRLDRYARRHTSADPADLRPRPR